MIPILRFSEPFFYFLSACVAAVVCVTSLYGMRLKSGRTVYSAVSFIGSAAVIAGVLVLFYRDWMVLPSSLWGSAAYGVGLCLLFADLIQWRIADKMDGWLAWFFGLIVAMGLTLYLTAVFEPGYLSFFRPLASTPALTLVLILGSALFYAAFGDEKRERGGGKIVRLTLALFFALALTGLYALPRMIGA